MKTISTEDIVQLTLGRIIFTAMSNGGKEAIMSQVRRAFENAKEDGSNMYRKIRLDQDGGTAGGHCIPKTLLAEPEFILQNREN